MMGIFAFQVSYILFEKGVDKTLQLLICKFINTSDIKN
jgi:hypothetical protein